MSNSTCKKVLTHGSSRRLESVGKLSFIPWVERIRFSMGSVVHTVRT